jgi:hypothetical protein
VWCSLNLPRLRPRTALLYSISNLFSFFLSKDLLSQ